MEYVGVKDAPFHGGDSFASESGCLQDTESLSYNLSNQNVFDTTGPTTVAITQGYGLPSNRDFQQLSAVFNGGIRSFTWGLKPVF